MGIGVKVVDGVRRDTARLLVTRAATPLILVGTLILAAFGAARFGTIAPSATTVGGSCSAPSGGGCPVIDSPAIIHGAPQTFCYADPDGGGHVLCRYLPLNQPLTASNLGCYTTLDGQNLENVGAVAIRIVVNENGTWSCYYVAQAPTMP